jgi:UMF1 family MFS transporter
MGRVSAFGWSLGYLGGLSVLGLCLGAIAALGPRANDLGVPVAMGLVSLCYGLAALPTFFWVPERSAPSEPPASSGVLRAGFGRLKQTAQELGDFPSLRFFLASAFAYACGTFTVIVLAAVYAREVFGFGTPETLVLIVFLNLAAALGAYGFGQLQDRVGSVPALGSSLALWVAALGLAYAAPGRSSFWAAALGMGVALGGSQSVGRALLGLLSPVGRYAEFYGFWGMTLRLAAIVGPVSYGAIAACTGGNLRLGLLSTAAYFVAGILLLMRVDETRGRAEAGYLVGRQGGEGDR